MGVDIAAAQTAIGGGTISMKVVGLMAQRCIDIATFEMFGIIL
jgi:hypothetical protein